MDWTRGRTIGRGSSATVSLATSSRSGDIFAVKSAELSQSKFLQREEKILSSLSNPRIVSYKGADITREDDKLVYNLLMEYVAGGTLWDRIQKQGGRLDEPVIGYYGHQIVQGLEYLHSVGLIHCDIKGQNILVGEDGVKIGDLGCAKWIDQIQMSEFSRTGEQAMSIAGTPMFMAPEAARGEEQGFAADVWALGCTIIEMATGGSPWPDVDDPVSVLYRIAFSGELPRFPSILSEQAKDFLSKCLRRDPKERWTASQLLNHPFLEEFNSREKIIQECKSNSPTSILDQDIWDSMEESATLGNPIHASSSNSPAERVRQLASFSRTPSWTRDENWVTIRSNINEVGDILMEAEADSIFGSLAASTVDNMEELESPVISEDLLNLSDSYFSSRNCSYIKDSFVSSNLNFERHREFVTSISSRLKF